MLTALGGVLLAITFLLYYRDGDTGEVITLAHVTGVAALGLLAASILFFNKGWRSRR